MKEGIGSKYFIKHAYIALQVPVYAIHRDERHFPDPDSFKPERFDKEEREKRHPMAFMAFSHGPRMCIGMRFALLEIKVSSRVGIFENSYVPGCPKSSFNQSPYPKIIFNTRRQFCRCVHNG